jgi:hypothetical protein
VKRFKERMFKVANVTLIVVAVVLFYLLFMPSAKHSKTVRPSRSKVSKAKDAKL